MFAHARKANLPDESLVQEFTISSVDQTPLYSTSIRIFTSDGMLKQGLLKLTLWPCCKRSTKAGEESVSAQGQPSTVHALEFDERHKLRQQLGSYLRDEIQRTPWLDRLSIPALESSLSVSGGAGSPGSVPSSGALHLEIQLPSFSLPVVFDEAVDEAFLALPQVHPQGALTSRAGSAGGNMSQLRSQLPSTDQVFSTDARNIWARRANVITDPEEGLPSLAEAMHAKLEVVATNTAADKERKPNKRELVQIQDIIKSPQYDVSTSRGLLWKFRYSLTDDPRALAKFLLAVDWADRTQEAVAVAMLKEWAPMDTADALRLLFPDFANLTVREFAVATLRKAPQTELELYLLQLVQALRYEPGLKAKCEGVFASAVERFRGQTAGIGQEEVPPAVCGPFWSSWCACVSDAATMDARRGQKSSSRVAYMLSPLADFLVDRACQSSPLASYFHWYLTVETEDERHGVMYKVALAMLFDMLKRIPPQLTTASEVDSGTDNSGVGILRMLTRQVHVVSSLKQVGLIAKGRANINIKKDQLRTSVAAGGEHGLLADLCSPEWMSSGGSGTQKRLPPLQLPLDPACKALAVIPEGCTIFQSSVYPVRLEFAVAHAASSGASTAVEQSTGAARARSESEGSSSSAASHTGKYRIIFKVGDDLRQDQLIMQMIRFVQRLPSVMRRTEVSLTFRRLMDSVWQKVNLDLQLTAYRVLATSTDTGMMEFVDNSVAVEHVKTNILAFFKQHNPDESAPYGVETQAMLTYVKSCAGYCVITYLLGVGDRHYDNLMLLTTGRFFHVDFGFIFGNDPKPMAPPMKITKHMIEGMGGVDSDNYIQFRRYCVQAFNIIRKHATLFMNLLHLMRDAGIQDMGQNPQMTLDKVQEKFLLGQDDETAERVFLKLIDESVAALAPQFSDYIHTLATRLR